MTTGQRERAARLARLLAAQLRHQQLFHGVVGIDAGAMGLPATGTNSTKGRSKAPDPGAKASTPAQEARTQSGGMRASATVVPGEPGSAQRSTTRAVASSSSSSVANPTQPPARPNTAETQAVRATSNWSAAEKLSYLRERNVGDCRRCPLHRTRTNLVFGVGHPQARMMFIGEAPGAEEDRRGEPFVGAAGQRLTQWVEALGLAREDVYIANVLKCRPPGNRDPQPAEVQKCGPFLRAQIRAISPRVIVALGRYSGALLTGKNLKLYELRSRPHVYADPRAPELQPALFVTYHPSYVLRTEAPGADRGRAGANEKVMADLRRAHAVAMGS